MMKIRAMLSAVLCTVACLASVPAACAGDSPSEVSLAFVKALQRFDFDKLVKLCDGQMAREFRRSANELETVKAAAAKGDDKAKQALVEIEKMRKILETVTVSCGAQKVEDDFAAVKIISKREGHPQDEETFYLRKVDGRWKIVSKDDYTAAKKAAGAKVAAKMEAAREKAAAKPAEPAKK